MIRGIYSAATGMIAGQFVQDALAGNLANLNTVGYKQDTPSFKALQDMALKRIEGGQRTAIGAVGMGSAFDHTTTSMAAGVLAHTGNDLDLALVGSGFFSVATPQGERYTRAGQFHVQPAGKDATGKPVSYLADDNGDKVLGLKGAILLGDAKEVTVGPQGDVLVDGKVVDRLKLAGGPDANFEKVGGNLFTAKGAVTASKATVQSGTLEQSNVSAITGMVRMITVQRAYDAAQRAITAQDDSLGKSVNEVGRV
jgi:flagellar basal-body rod protein FlgG